jgi:hypothetical protein
LGQFLGVIPNNKRYLLDLVPSKLVFSKLVVAIGHHMARIEVQVGKNFIEDVFLDSDSKINIIIKKLRMQLGLSKPKLAPYNLHMVNQSIVKPLVLIKNIKIFVHGIPYVITFIVVHSSVSDFKYFMLLGHPWPKGVKVSHD